MGFFDSSEAINAKVTLLQPLFYPNTWVTGIFSFDVIGEQFKMRAIRIKFEGNETTTVQMRNQNGQARTQTSTNLLIRQFYIVSGSSKSSPNSTDHIMAPGEYAIPFQFLLPSNVPPSGTQRAEEGSYEVLYGVTGIIDIPWGKDTEASCGVGVGNWMPVGQYQNLAQPVGLRGPQVIPIQCACISKGQVTFSATAEQGVILLDRPGFLNATLRIDNTYGEEAVDVVHCSIVNWVEVRASGYEKQIRGLYSNMVAEPHVGPGQTSEFRVTLQCSTNKNNLFPTMNGVCASSIWYVELELDIPYATDPKVLIPIVAAQGLDETNHAPAMVVGGPEGKYGQKTPAPCRQDSKVLMEYRYSLPGALEQYQKGLWQLPPIGPGGTLAPYAPPPSGTVV